MNARHAVPAPLALLHRAEIRGAVAVALALKYSESGDGARERSICSTPRCATARRPTASISRSPTSSRSSACSTSSASTMSRAAIPAPIRPTRSCSPSRACCNTTFTAFGMTRRPGRSTSNDPGLAALLDAKADAICFVAKSWDYHVRVALETTLEENLASIRDSVKAAKAKGREVLLDCEHFFDGYKANPSYALACAKAAYEEGARWVVLCDTNGGTLPHEVEAIVARGGQAHSRRSRRHPRPQRHRAGGGEFVRRGARRRPPDPGHAQRARRALRQRQSRLDHPDAEAEAGVCREVRDRRLRRAS